MVFEPNFTKVVSSTRRNVGTMQSIVELKLPTNDNQINTIYSATARSTITNIQPAGKEVNFVGLVDFQVIYEGEGIEAIDYSAEFKDRFVANETLMGEVVVTSTVVDVNSSIVSGGIRVLAIVEIVIDEIASQDLNVLVGVKGDAFVSANEIEFSTYLGKAIEKFDVTNDIVIRNADKILMVMPCAFITSITPKDNYLVLNGCLKVDICYKQGDDRNSLASTCHTFDFVQEVALQGIRPDSLVQSDLSIVFNEIKITTTLDDDSANVNIFIPMVYTGYIFNNNNISVVDDVYLEKNYLSITSENFDSIGGRPSIAFKDNISGTASISDTAPFIDEILGVCTNNLVMASSRIENDRLIIEGVANTTVVYFTKETDSVTSVQVEMPFSVEERVEGEISNVVSLCLSETNARSKRGKEIEVSAELNVYSDIYDIETNNIITNITVGDQKPIDDCTLYLYIVRPNQTIWDIAKEMGVSQELILEQNPEVDLPVKSGDKLVIYKSRIVEY